MFKEYKNYKPFLDEITDKTLKRRAEFSLKYYINHAVLYKCLWHIFSAAGIVLPALATLVASLNKDEYNYIVVLITACTTVVTGFLALFKCADKKTSYRNSAENLKSELCAYASQKGIYAGEMSDRDEILFNRMEGIIREGYQRIEALENEKEERKDEK